VLDAFSGHAPALNKNLPAIRSSFVIFLFLWCEGANNFSSDLALAK
jgi:hypothetical protein